MTTRKKKPRADRPAEFQSPLEREPTWWETIRLTEADLALMATFLDDPRGCGTIRGYLAAFGEVSARDQARWTALPWGTMNAYALITFVEAQVAVQTGILGFLPPSCSELAFSDRLSLYATTLALVGVAQGDPPLLWPRRAHYYLVGGALADEELARRAPKHLGVQAGIVLLAADVFRRAGYTVHEAAPADLRQDVDRAVRLLKHASTRSTPRDLQEDVGGQMFDTLLRRWGKLDGFEALARGFGGDLDIAPRAVRDQLLKQERPEARWARRGIDVVIERRPADAEVPWDDQVASDAPSPAAVAALRAQLARIQQAAEGRDPRVLEAVAGLLRGETHREVAARLGTHERTVRKWLKALQEEVQPN